MKTAILIDLDNTIFDTRSWRVGFWKFFSDHISSDTEVKVIAMLEDNLKNKAVFAPDRVMPRDEWKHLKEYMKKIGPQFLFSDTHDFLKNINRQKYDPMILTFGGAKFQRAKIAPLNLGLPAVFLEHHDKTAEIETWWRGDYYDINGRKFAQIILVDDQDYSFMDFEKLPQARGFWLQRPESPTPSEKARFKSLLPTNVEAVTNLMGIKI